jgi:hypothetical protein
MKWFVRPLSIIISNNIKPKVASSTRIYDIKNLIKSAQVRKIKEVRSSVRLVLMKGLPSLIARCAWVTGKQIPSLARGHKGVLMTLAEHCSRKTLIAHVKSKHAEVVSDAIIRLLKGEKEDLQKL